MTLSLNARWDRAASSGDSVHWLAVTCSLAPVAEAPASIAVLVDASTSMLGDRLSQARVAVAGLVAACRPADRVCVFSFANQAQALVEARGGDDVATVLSALAAGGKTRLDLGLAAASAWLGTRTGVRHMVILTDGDPTDAEGRRAPTQALINGAAALGASGVRAAVIGLGQLDGCDPAFLRALADAFGGTAFVRVPPSQLVTRTLSALHAGLGGAAGVHLSVESSEIRVEEAWRVVPRVQPVPVLESGVTLPMVDGGVLLLKCQFVSPLGAGRGNREVGLLRAKVDGGNDAVVALRLALVSPSSPDRNVLDEDVDRLRVKVELARTASLRASTDDVGDQLRLTRRLSELVDRLEDPRATARVSHELRQLAAGVALDADAREDAVSTLRGGTADDGT